MEFLFRMKFSNLVMQCPLKSLVFYLASSFSALVF